MAEQNNQVARELKQLDTKELDPTSLNVWELRGRSVNEELCMSSIRQPPPGSICVHGAIQNSKVNDMCLPLPLNQSSLVLVSSISPQSSSDLDTDQGDIIDETIKQVAQSVNQTLLKTSTSNPISSLTQNDAHMTILQTGSQSMTQTQMTFIHKQIHTHRPVSPKNSITHPATSFKQAKEIIMNIDALSHSPILQNKFLQELNLPQLG